MFYDFVTPEQLATLTDAVDDYCGRHNLVGATRSEVAFQVMQLFQGAGVNPADIPAALEAMVLLPFTGQWTAATMPTAFSFAPRDTQGSPSQNPGEIGSIAAKRVGFLDDQSLGVAHR